MLQCESLRLARQLASAVLQFHETPILKESWRSEDVVFFGQQQHLDPPATTPRHEDAPSQCSSPDPARKIQHYGSGRHLPQHKPLHLRPRRHPPRTRIPDALPRPPPPGTPPTSRLSPPPSPPPPASPTPPQPPTTTSPPQTACRAARVPRWAPPTHAWCGNAWRAISDGARGTSGRRACGRRFIGTWCVSWRGWRERLGGCSLVAGPRGGSLEKEGVEWFLSV